MCTLNCLTLVVIVGYLDTHALGVPTIRTQSNQLQDPSPEGVPQANAKQPRKEAVSNKEPVLEMPTALGDSNVNGNNKDFNPVIVDEFLGCDVVLDADQTLDDIQNTDDLDAFDKVGYNTQMKKVMHDA